MNKEDVSLLVDGELTPESCRELLDELGQDRDMRRTWARYHLIGELIRGAETAPASADDRLPLRQPQVFPIPTAVPRRRPVPMAGFAIAAGIAALAVTLVLRAPDGTTPPRLDLAQGSAAAAPPVTLAVASAAPEILPAVSLRNAQRMNGYLVNFNEQRARLAVPGVHPYVRIVGFESR